ncbi:hypothetical protein B0T16DRAFT_384429 [Cercophora newfieldiana]|uniref:Uncharacterized protein n=1 Tax=Cercophora newfieldiana TaxID=92897 RepID=A0AA39YPD8_9PEZI|nr:hypothetical protein B0T16DRAFT_384429 [Cercophora newfieldiana]
MSSPRPPRYPPPQPPSPRRRRAPSDVSFGQAVSFPEQPGTSSNATASLAPTQQSEIWDNLPDETGNNRTDEWPRVQNVARHTPVFRSNSIKSQHGEIITPRRDSSLPRISEPAASPTWNSYEFSGAELDPGGLSPLTSRSPVRRRAPSPERSRDDVSPLSSPSRSVGGNPGGSTQRDEQRAV